MVILLFFLLACPGVSAQISSPTMYQPQIFDVQHYDARITFPDPAQRTIIGDVSIIVQWTANASNATFPFHLRDLTIDSVFVNGVATTAATVGSSSSDTMHHRVAITHSVVADQYDTIRVMYRGTMTNEGGSTPWGGVQYQDSVLYCLGVGFKNSYVSATQHWLACYDHPSDKATFRAKFIVPFTPWVVASVGTQIITRPPWPEGYAIYEWSEDHPASTYLLTFAVAPYKKIVMDGVVPHVFYTLARDSAKSAQSYAKVPQMTAYFAGLYGAYPFDKVGYCNTQVGAMEHQTMISFPVSKVQSNDTINATAAHELAHQWFGDNVSPLDFRYAWLTESFATYSECAWLETVRGWPIYLKSVSEKARSYISKIAGAEGLFALENFPRKSPSSNYPQTIYQKGAVVVAMMRAIAGDSAFYNALKQYQATHAYGTATTADMKEAMRPALGARTDGFFDEWVTGIGWPVVDLGISYITNDSLHVTITQVQRTTHPTWPLFYTLPLNVVYTRTSGATTDTVNTIMYPNEGGNIDVTCRQFISVNAGSLCRSLVETGRTTLDFIQRAQSTEATYSLSPQPATDSITLTRASATSTITVRIVDVRGATVITLTLATGDAQAVIDLRTIASGAYYVVIEDGKEVVWLPLSVTRGQ